jgi:uncharacterized membrane protein
MTVLHALLFIHLAGLIMGFVGGRSHGEIMKRLPSSGSEAAGVLWDLERKASWTAFVGTAILVPSGMAMLWLKWGGPQYQPPLFWVKISLVVVVAWAEIARHRSALAWRDGDERSHYWTRFWGKISGLSAIGIVVIFN